MRVVDLANDGTLRVVGRVIDNADDLPLAPHLNDRCSQRVAVREAVLGEVPIENDDPMIILA